VVAAFLDGFIPFTQIPILIEDAINKHDWISNPDLEAISELSSWTSQFIQEQITTYA
jgi:1-deoxy-D-xylulose-5-phosphate reductoisomerase